MNWIDKPELLDLLQCPGCGGALKLHYGTGKWGIVECACSEYPIVDGILCLTFNSSMQRKFVLQAIKNDEFQSALVWMMEAAPLARMMADTPLSRALFYLMTLVQTTGHRYQLFRHIATFLRKQGIRKMMNADLIKEAAQYVVSPGFANYLEYRFSHPSLIAAVITLQSVCQPPIGIMIDVGGGCGHLESIIRKRLNIQTSFVLDRTFPLLWLGRKFGITRGNLICADAADGLPFREGISGLTVSVDVLNYVYPKRIVASEIMRVTLPQGRIFFGHLHNKNQYNLAAGIPLGLDEWRRALGVVDNLKFFSEEALLRQYFRNPEDFTFNLSNFSSPKELDNSTAFSACNLSPNRSQPRGPLEVFRSLNSVARFVPNRLYVPTSSGIMTRQWPSQRWKRDCSILEELQPETWSGMPGSGEFTTLGLGDELFRLWARFLVWESG